MDIDDQSVGIWQQKRRVLRYIVYIEHHARHLVAKLGSSDLLEKTVIRYRKVLADEL